MTLFGDRATFAVEAQFQEIYGKWIYGSLRFWIAGISIGDFEDTSDLASSARWGRTFLQASARRTRADLDMYGAEDVYDILYGRFVVNLRNPAPSARGLATDPMEPWDRRPYLLDEVGESALRDKFAVLAVRTGDGSDRFVVNDYVQERIWQFIAPPGTCDLTIDTYCRWVEGLPGSATF